MKAPDVALRRKKVEQIQGPNHAQGRKALGVAVNRRGPIRVPGKIHYPPKLIACVALGNEILRRQEGLGEAKRVYGVVESHGPQVDGEAPVEIRLKRGAQSGVVGAEVAVLAALSSGGLRLQRDAVVQHAEEGRLAVVHLQRRPDDLRKL